jgi:aminoglycoside 6'-N-acetyltransferase
MNDNIKLRLLKDTELDYKLLYKWYYNPEVYKYFEQRIPTYNEIVEKYSKRTSLTSITPVYIIEYNNIPVGIIQYTKLTNKAKKTYNIIKDGYEIDIFIGEDDYYHKGIGSNAIKLLIDKLKQNKTIFVMVPEIENINAIKCYEKVGFKQINTFKESNTIGIIKDKIVMIYDK